METIKDEIPPDPPKLERSNRFYIHNNICYEEQKERHENERMKTMNNTTNANSLPVAHQYT